jgi:hypothetical protein
VATFENDRVLLTALLAGKPVPSATFTWVDSDLAGDELKADADGRATFTPPGPGVFSIYTAHVDHTPGQHASAKYTEVREFATLSFNWPLAAAGADPEAVKLFEDAIATRAVWKDFPGFSAKIGGDVEDRPFEGTVAVAADGSVKLELQDDVLAGWVRDQLESITMHRAANERPATDRAKPVLRFADDHPDHPLGRLLVFDGGQFASSYRIKNGQIATVNRLLDGKNMTITVLDTSKNSEGLTLPHCYTVQYWDEPTGTLERTETAHDLWVRVGQWDLPKEHTVTTSSQNGFSVRSMKLSDHQLRDRKSN